MSLFEGVGQTSLRLLGGRLGTYYRYSGLACKNNNLNKKRKQYMEFAAACSDLPKGKLPKQFIDKPFN